MAEHYFRAVFKREFKRILTNPIYLVSMVLTMSVFYLFYLTFFDEGLPQKLPVAIVDRDGSSISRRFVKELQATQYADIQYTLSSHKEARELMQEGKIYAFIDIPGDFYSDLLAFKRPEISYYVNYSYLIGGTLTFKDLTQMATLASGAVQRELLRTQGFTEDKIMDLVQPVILDAHYIGNPWTNYSLYLLSTILPGLLGIIAMLMTVYSIGSEMKEKTSRECYEVGGRSMKRVIIGKVLPYTIICSIMGIIGNALIFRYMHFSLNWQFATLNLSVILLVVAMQAIGITFIGAMPILRDGICLTALFSVITISLSGFTYPVESMYPAIQAWSYIAPLRHYYLTYVHTLLYGLGPLSSTLQYGALIAFQMLPFLVSKRLTNAFTMMNYEEQVDIDLIEKVKKIKR